MQTDGLNATEAECAAGRTAPRVSLADIKANISGEYFNTADLMFSGAPVLPGMDLLTICILVLRNGFTIIGKSAPASRDNFDPILGQKLAYEDAVRQIWPLMGYALRQQLHDATMPELENLDATEQGDLEQHAPNSWRKTATINAVEAVQSETMPTKWGDQTAQPGDFIVTNPDGERYPVDRDTFLSTYAPA